MNGKKIKASLLMLSLTACVAPSIWAQQSNNDQNGSQPPAAGSTTDSTTDQGPGGAMGPHGRAMNPNHQLKMMTRQLGLSSDQQTQILPILQTRDSQASQIMSDGSLQAQDRRMKMRAVMQDANQKLRAALTDAQRQKFDAWQQERREKMQNRGADGQGGQMAPPDSSAPPASTTQQ